MKKHIKLTLSAAAIAILATSAITVFAGENCEKLTHLCPGRTCEGTKIFCDIELKSEARQKILTEQNEKARVDSLEKAEKIEKIKHEKQEKLKQDKLDQEKALLEAKKKSALEAKRKETLKAEQEQLENQKIEILRESRLVRMAGLAVATGGAEAKGGALQSSAPSSGYAGKLRARIKPNIVFNNDIAGNPTVEIEVRTAPDGTIVSRKLLKSSGVKAWDDAVLKAIDKTDALPKDTDGRVPSTLIISFRPKD